MDAETIAEMAAQTASAEIWGVWYLMGAALVFFMQAGFAMVETGFTRAKNAGNIIMKNLMDFCIGTVVFVLLGFTLMMSENYLFGFIGMPDLQIFTNYEEFPWSSFVFNLVFCATAATIVSGAMAERTKFSAYCIYSAVISAVVYPIEAGWIWNSQGWLFKLGFIDFAGSCAIHMVGGITALIGAVIVGPRLGKYTRDKSGSVVKVHAFPGHSLTLGALGCFILWFGWYGFNGAAAVTLDGVGGLASIFLTTTISPAVATCVAMCFTWIKNGKPDVSMSLNGSLAGLVGITAGCATLDVIGALVVGIVSGFLVVFAVEFLDLRLHIDDPVGAVAVHCANGIWGTIAVGLFHTQKGLFYGGGAAQLGIQLLGIIAVGLYTAVFMTIVFLIIRKFHGLRVSAEEEIAGLDVREHGIVSSYADFMPSPQYYTDTVSAADTVPVQQSAAVSETKPRAVCDGHQMWKVTIVTRQDKFNELKAALNKIEVTGMTVSNVLGCGIQKGAAEKYRGVPLDFILLPKVKVEVVVSKIPVETVIAAAKAALYTGHIGDGKIFVYAVDSVVKVRTGEVGYAALQDDAE